MSHTVGGSVGSTVRVCVCCELQRELGGEKASPQQCITDLRILNMWQRSEYHSTLPDRLLLHGAVISRTIKNLPSTS